MTSTTRPYASTLAPGAPVGDIIPGTGAFTSLSTTLGLTSTANWGSQARFGIAGQAGKIELARGNDGGFTAGLGFVSPTDAGAVELFNAGGSGTFTIKLNRSISGFTETFRFTSANDGSLGVAVGASVTARLHLPAGAAAAGRAPMKFTSGALLTSAEPGAEEFLTNDRYFTGTDGARRRYAVNGQVITLRGYTVAALPTAVQGDKAFVTDAVAPTYLAGVVGGGTIVTEVFYNGTSWVCT